MMLPCCLHPHADGVILKVQAHAGARKNGIQGLHDQRLKVCVTQAPEKGKANIAIVAVLTESLRIKKSQVLLLAGKIHPHKDFLITGITVEELTIRLKSHLE